MNKKQMLIFGGVIGVFGVVALALLAVNQAERRIDGRESRMKQSSETFEKRGSERGVRDSYQDRGKGSGMGAGQGQGRGMGMGSGMNRENCLADECLAVEGLDYPAGTLSDTAKQALLDALDDEYKALSVYQSVVGKFGAVRPFIMISRAEEQHISSLKGLFDKYGVVIPENQYLSKVSAPETLLQACQTGVDAEVANAALYKDTLLPAVKDYADLTSVFTHLMNASQERHLPAFDRCN